MSNIISFEKARAERAPQLVRLHIELAWIEPKIWRRVIVPSHLSLDQIHRIIQTVFGWKDGHLHEFDFEGERYGIPDPIFDLNPIRPEQSTSLKAALGKLDTFKYVYDFGDNWLHLITVEEHLSGGTAPTSPIECLGGENAAPPEDVGGAPGYEDFQTIMADDQHPEHQSMKRWFKQGYRRHFDARFFDLNTINKALKKLKL